MDVPFATAQDLPHWPQLLPLLLSEVSHPDAAVQSPKPSRHLTTLHSPATQAVVAALGKARQSLPQVPQFATSVFVSVQLAPHWSAVGAAHLPTQVYFPSEVLAHKDIDAEHALPQAPQASGRPSAVSQISPSFAVQCE